MLFRFSTAFRGVSTLAGTCSRCVNRGFCFVSLAYLSRVAKFESDLEQDFFFISCRVLLLFARVPSMLTTPPLSLLPVHIRLRSDHYTHTQGHAGAGPPFKTNYTKLGSHSQQARNELKKKPEVEVRE